MRLKSYFNTLIPSDWFQRIYSLFPCWYKKKINCELEFADQMAYSEFSPDWIVKES